ncbi:MAG: DUF2157 domain-containing protein [Clostridiales bacterium]|nr:DUF2157 domain-containing protein [Clostridiales bacterium]
MEIFKESKRWVELGIIDDAARENILALYPEPKTDALKKRSFNPLYVLFAVLGTLLISLGVILIFAVNWENIPRNLKLFIAFLPLIAAMCVFLYTLLKRRDSMAFREGAALGLCLSILATVALVNQVFHIPFGIATYIRLCLFLFLPAIYLLEAKSPAALYVACAIIAGAGRQSPLWASLLSVAAFMPFLIIQIKKTNYEAVIRYLAVLSGALLAFLVFRLPDAWADSWIDPMILFLSCAVLLFALDTLIKRQKKLDGIMPLTLLACLTIIIVLMLSSFQDFGPLYWVAPKGLILLFGSVILYAGIRFYKQPFKIETADMIVLCALLGFPLFWLWSNILLVALGVWFIATSVKVTSLKRVNYGMLLLVFVIAARFFDSNLGLLERGIAFIAVGAGFILTNLLLHKKWRAR